MSNLIYRLETRFKQPLLLENTQTFNIYVDESILYNQANEDIVATHFFTAFYTIEEKKLDQFNQDYHQNIYANGAKKERKSTSVPDQVNRLALEVAGKYMTNAFVLERQAYDYSKYADWKQNLFLSLELMSYIQPIQSILKVIKKVTNASKIIVNVIIDQTNRNSVDPCLSLNKEFLNRLAQENSDDQTHFEINYETVDSKLSYGIQAADMLAGAYRKELVYKQSNYTTNLIPFDYDKKVLASSLEDNSEFLQIFGKLIYQQIPQVQWNSLQKQEPAKTTKTILKPNRPSFTDICILILNKIKDFVSSYFPNDVWERTISLLEEMKRYTNLELRKQIILMIEQLNRKLYSLCKKFIHSGGNFITELSIKTDNSHYTKTISNIETNLNLINKKCNNIIAKNRVNRILRDFQVQAYNLESA